MNYFRRFYFFTVLLIFETRHLCEGAKIVNGCPEHFARVQMHCTTLVFSQIPFAKAVTECKNQNSLMFMIKDQATYDSLLSASPGNTSDAEKAAKEKGGGMSMSSLPGNLMMGLQYTVSDKKWHWADGTFFNPTSDWAMWGGVPPPAEPAKDGCVVWKKKGKDIKWDLADCNTPGLTLCYAPAKSKVQTCPDKYMQEVDLCIMPLMQLDSSFTNGETQCKAAGDGMVAMLKEEAEFKKIQSLGSGMLDKLPVPVWMGLKYYAAESKWKWSDGTEYKMGTDWGLWKDKKPPPTPATDMCVTMMKGGSGMEWNTEECAAQKGLVVCAKKATPDPTGESTGEGGAPAAAAPAASGGAAAPAAPAAPAGGGGGGGGGKGGAMGKIASTERVIEALIVLALMNWFL